MMSPILGPCLSLTAFPEDSASTVCWQRSGPVRVPSPVSCSPSVHPLSPVRAPAPHPRMQGPSLRSGLLALALLSQPALALWRSVVLPLHQAPSQPVLAVFGLQPPHPAWQLTGLLNLLFSELAVLFYRSTGSSRRLCPEHRH